VDKKLTFDSRCLEDTAKIGEKIAQVISLPSCIYLQADMGMGKTTLSKSIIRALGCDESVTSPTYNLIQEYPIRHGIAYHMDLYRLEDPEELDFLALDDLWTNESLFLVEWPEKGQGYLPPANYTIRITSDQTENSRIIELVTR